MKASEIAALVEGRLEGDTDPVIRGVSPLDRAGPSDLSLLARARYLPYFRESRAAAVLVAEADAEEPGYSGARIVVDDVHQALSMILPQLYEERKPELGIHPTAVLADDVIVGTGASIGPYVVIGAGSRLGDGVRVGAHTVIGADCTLAEGVLLHPQVTLYDGVSIGANSIVHSGARIGVDGFGYTFVDGSHRKVPQVGGCQIGADVEIGANTTIDRGSIGMTEVGDNVKIDNLAHLGHNVRVGDRSIVVAQVGVAGSTTIGPGVTLGGQAGIAGHLDIGPGATVAAQAGVFGDLEGGAVYSGYPARPHKESLRAQAGLFRLQSLIRRVSALERKILGLGKSEE